MRLFCDTLDGNTRIINLKSINKNMMTPEELIKNASLSNIEVNSDQTVVFTEIAKTAVNMARMEANQSPWVSIEDRFLEKYKDVFAKYTIRGKIKYDILFRCNSTEWYFTNMEEYIDESMIVTHWMPIPE